MDKKETMRLETNRYYRRRGRMTKKKANKIEGEPAPIQGDNTPILKSIDPPQEPPPSQQQLAPIPLEQILQGLLAQTEALLSEVNELKSKMATKEYVNSSLIGGFETFAKNIQASGTELAVQPSNTAPASVSKKNSLAGMTELGRLILEGIKAFQPRSDERLIQLGEAGFEFSRIAIMNAMRVQAKALGLPTHLEMESHGVTGSNSQP